MKILLPLILFANTLCYAQNKYEPWNRFEKSTQVGIGSGSSTYFGDIHPVNNIHSYISSVRWSGSVNITRHLNPYYSLRLNLSWTRLVGDDFSFTRKQINNTTAFDVNFLRNLSFRNDIKEISFLGLLNLKNGFYSHKYTQRPHFIPYILCGFSIFHNQTYGREPYTKTAGLGSWTKIDVSKASTKFGIAIPLGLGFRKKITNRLDTNLEIYYSLLFTDYIDDIIEGAFPPNTSNGQTDFTNRGTERYSAMSGADRGSFYDIVALRQGFSTPSGVTGKSLAPTIGYPNSTPERGTKGNDAYLIATLKLQYYFKRQSNCKL